ncbi:MAG: hypothetical protein ACRDTV_02300 [Mycobacterium sp.]
MADEVGPDQRDAPTDSDVQMGSEQDGSVAAVASNRAGIRPAGTGPRIGREDTHRAELHERLGASISQYRL